MYLYRVVPNSVICENKYSDFNSTAINRTEFLGAEDIYYNMGYTSFIDEVNTVGKEYDSIPSLSTVSINRQSKGKFFFLYLDEALENCSTIINGFGNKDGYTYCLLVYDFPIDIIIKNIGYGYYEGHRREQVLETAIQINDFGSNISNSKQISDKEKLKTLRDLLSNTLLTEIELFSHYSSYSVDTLIRYVDEFKDFDLKKLRNEEWLNSKIQSCKLFDNILKYDGFIVKSKYLVGKNIPINIGWYNRHTFGNLLAFCNDILKKNGIDDYIDDNCYKKRNDIINHMITYPEDKESIKKLLKSK